MSALKPEIGDVWEINAPNVGTYKALVINTTDFVHPYCITDDFQGAFLWSRNYSRSATRSSAKPVVKTSTPKASQIKKQVAERPQKENPGHQASSGNLLPWIFYGHTISRSQSNGKISCDCSSLKDKSELYQECLRQCPKSKKNK